MEPDDLEELEYEPIEDPGLNTSSSSLDSINSRGNNLGHSNQIRNLSMGSNFFSNKGSNFGLGRKNPIGSQKNNPNQANNKGQNQEAANQKNNLLGDKGNSANGVNKKAPYNKNGYQPTNQYKSDNKQDGVKDRLAQAKYKQNQEAAKKAVKTAAGAAAGPVGEMAAEAAMKTPKGKRYLDAYAKADSPVEGINNVKREIKKDNRRRKIAVFLLVWCLPLLLLLILIAAVFKNADSQIYSNENGGSYQSENYIGDDKVVNIYANYPGLYENMMEKIENVSEKYQTEIDKYLIIATLIAPISNELIVPVEDHSCGEENCYYFKGKSVTWSEFLKSWSDQAELLAKMQLLTYTNNQNELVVNCGPEETMEQYAQNDLSINEFPWWGWLNPVNWFKGFRDSAAAEVNANCVDANNGEYEVPTVRVLSIEQGEYYLSYNENREYEYIKDPNSGGVYFWNLINKNGFIHEYLKDYLNSDFSDDPDKNYEINKKVIVETVNYIYSYYDSIKKDCNGYPVMEGELEKVNFREDGSSPIYSLDFEDVFVGGSVLATYGGAKGEVARAQAILTRSEAYNFIVEQGRDVITGSAKMGCWWWKYNPTYDPSYENQEDNPNYDPDYPKVNFPEIYNAVTETRGIVVTQYGGTKVLETEYDAFCPTTKDPMDGFYYLPDGQRNLPIEFSRFWATSWPDCPCFQNEDARPDVEFEETLNILTKKAIGNPEQTTLEKCWTPTGETKIVQENGEEVNGNTVINGGNQKVLYGFKYKPTGGHGRGVSQHGMAYFAQFGYNHEGLIRLFLDRDGMGAAFKVYDGSIEDKQCDNHGYFIPEDYDGIKNNTGKQVNYKGNKDEETVYASSEISEIESSENNSSEVIDNKEIETNNDLISEKNDTDESLETINDDNSDILLLLSIVLGGLIITLICMMIFNRKNNSERP